MLWLLGKVIVFQAAVLFFSCVAMGLATWRYEEQYIDRCYEREVRSLRLVSIGEKADERLPVERRALAVSEAVITYVDSIKIPAGTNVLTRGLKSGASRLAPGAWWSERFKPRAARFLPILYMRLETFLVFYYACFPLIVLAYFLGEYFARKAMWSGKGKKNHLVMIVKWGLSIMLTLISAGAGLVFFPPLVYWIVPVLIVSGLLVALGRSYHVEIR